MKRTRKTQLFINIVVWTITIATGLIVVTDGVMNWLDGNQAQQYAFNIAWFCLIMPGAIALSDVVEWAHPEFFTKEELERKGR